MKTLKLISALGFAAIILSSCTKDGCVLPEENVNTGAIIENSYVYGIQPIQSPGASSREVYHENYDNRFKVSFDQGYSYGDIDWDQYSVMNFPAQVTCRSAFERDVVISPASNRVYYTLTVHNCPGGCDDLYWVQNWVLVPDFPSHYEVTYIEK